MKKLTKLTPEQEARMGPLAQEWIQYGWRTQPLTDEEWAVWEQGARRCYEFAGIPWPGRVIRVGSPMVGAFAAPIAAYVIEKIRRGDELDSAVGSAVYSAVDSAVVRQVLSKTSYWWRRLGGRHWAWRNAFIDYFRDVAELQLDGDLWDRSRAYDDAMSAGWWFPFKDFVMVCDVPTVLHLEPSGDGPNGYRLHCEDGPAVAWADGWGLHCWHGIRVPADLIETGWTTDQILKEPNAEVRRCAIERMGWDWFVTEAGLEQVGDTVPDPGNPGQELSLYDIPAQIYDEPVRVLLCTNGTPEADGVRRRFGLTVPGSIKEPVAAAAWTFGLNPSEYKQLERAT